MVGVEVTGRVDQKELVGSGEDQSCSVWLTQLIKCSKVWSSYAQPLTAHFSEITFTFKFTLFLLLWVIEIESKTLWRKRWLYMLSSILLSQKILIYTSSLSNLGPYNFPLSLNELQALKIIWRLTTKLMS